MHPTKIALMLTLVGATWVASVQSDPMSTAATAAPTAEVAAVNDAPAAAAPDDICLPDQIRVHPQHQCVPMRLNDWLTLVVSGVCKA